MENSKIEETIFIVKMLNKVERLLKPAYMNSVFTWKQIEDAIKDDEPLSQLSKRRRNNEENNL